MLKDIADTGGIRDSESDCFWASPGPEDCQSEWPPEKTAPAGDQHEFQIRLSLNAAVALLALGVRGSGIAQQAGMTFFVTSVGSEMGLI
jgi:hypothetical protein